MPYPINYRRPPHVHDESIRNSISGAAKQDSIQESVESGNSGMSNGIPEALSFDRIIAGGVCPPCTIRDFMNYMKYIEHDAENLQFFLWYRDYCQRFERLPASEQVLSPAWTSSQADADAQAVQATRSKKVDPLIASVLRDTEFGDGIAQPVNHEKRDPFHDQSTTPSSEERRDVMSSDFGSFFDDEKTIASSGAFSRKADEAFDEAGMKWKPFTTQPFRQELTRIITIYIAVDSSRQLNLSDRERTAVLHALQNTTHPSALRAAANSVEFTLRRQAHPNFIRWTICNGNGPRVIFARGLGVAGILAGLLADLLITLSHAGRAWRVLPIIGYFIGVSTLIAAWKGMCVVLHGMHHRHLRPWELFADEHDPIHSENSSSESLTSNSTNSYEDEPWVAKYQKRNVVRKVFDREVWIQEPALRQIQDTIFIQSLLGAFVVSIIIVGIFCAVPHGNLY
ncbi:hypothetical protein AAFC00_003670 [Neodothiora populina]|uniref:Regulator of G protein signaling superfamily n=1 Tax=Neodothiora populina TaxID=2781224 RepID=A0ABR3PEZ0_9PEZI